MDRKSSRWVMNPVAKARGLPLAATNPGFHHRDLTDPKIDVWLHDISPDTQPRDRVSRRYERSRSTQTFLPSEGFIARTGKRSVGKVRAPKPLAHCWVPSGALPVYIRRASACLAGAPCSSPLAKARGLP